MRWNGTTLLKNSIPGLILLTILLCPAKRMLLAQGAPDNSREPVFLETKRLDNVLVILGVNTFAYPVTLTVEVSGENYNLDRPSPVTVVLNGGQKRRLFRVTVDDRSKPLKINRKYHWFAGNIHASHDDSFIYRLPFETNNSFVLSQGFDGEFSHSGNLKFALDFTMPVGTPVVAARGGIVVERNMNFEAGGPSIGLSERSNFVVLIHDDGTFGVYAHLEKNGVVVEEGDRVRSGEVIAYSGNTGYSSGPHLHFMVTKLQKDGSSISLPIRFKAERGIVTSPEAGQKYTAVE